MISPSKPALLFVLSGGGFTFETKCLLGAMDHDCNFVYLATHFGGDPGETGIPSGPRFGVPSFASITNRSWKTSAKAFIETFRIARIVIREQNIDAVVTVGCSHAVPMLLAGRFARRRTIYIESVTRVDRLSNTGRIVYHLRLAQKFIVQWPSLQKSWPASTLGTIL